MRRRFLRAVALSPRRAFAAVLMAVVAAACGGGSPAAFATADAPGAAAAGVPGVQLAAAQVALPSQSSTPGKLALIVAIGRYPDPNVNGYRSINSANDVPLITAGLKAQGFQDAQIRIIRDAEADRAGILAAMDDLLARAVGSSRVDLQACKLEYSIVSPK